jgi:hypothetical protein
MRGETKMRRKTPKRQPKISTDSLLKTSKKGDTELTEQELGKVSGGRKGNTPVEYIKLTMKEVIIS